MSFGFRIVQDDFTPKLADAPRKIRRLVSQAMHRVGDDMVGYSQAICPVRTGYLRSTIKFRIGNAELEFEFDASANYAYYVEYGTSKAAAQPFIRPTLDAYWTELQTAILQAVLEVFK